MHQFHIWGISEGEDAIMMHLVTTGIDDRTVFKEAVKICEKNKFRYYSIQIENQNNGFVCPIQTMY